MPFPVGMLEWEPAAPASRHKKRIVTISTNGVDEVATQPNYNSIRYNAFDSVDLSGTVWQACAFWDDNLHMVIGVRNTPYGAWTLYVYDGVAETPEILKSEVDGHNVISIMFDSTGVLHLAYDHHNVALNYRKTDAVISSFDGTLTAELTWLGTNETSVAYPTFFRSPTGVLYVMFRDGGSGNGDLFMYVYSTGGGTWSAVAGTTAGKVINGKGSTGVHSPYWHGPPRFTANWNGSGTGFMWLIWSWRNSTDAESEHDVSAVRWDGTNWTQADGTSQTMPITTTNCDIIDPIGENNTLASFNSMVIDSSGNPHAFHCYDDAGDSDRSKIWHVYWNGSAWTTPVAITPSSATAEYGFTSVDCVIDGDDTIRVIVCHHESTQRGICAWVSDGSDWTTWTLEVLTSRDTFYVESSILTTSITGQHDRYQWAANGVYRMMVPLTGNWRATADDFDDWSGYTSATADAPASAVEDVVLLVALDSSHTAFWAAVASDGDDIRAADAGGQQFARDLIEWNYAGEYALIAVHYFGLIEAAPTVRIYAGNGSAAAPGDDDDFGRHNTYTSDIRAYWPTGASTDRTNWNNDLTMTGSPATNAGAGPMGETCIELNGSTQYGLTTVSVPAVVPITAECYGKSDSDTVGQTPISLCRSTTSDSYWILALQGDVASDPVRARVRSAGVSVNADVIGYLANTWEHYAGRFSTNTARNSFINGTPSTTETTSLTPPGVNRIGVGVFAVSTLSSFMDGELAHARVWTRIVSTEQLAYHAAMRNQATFWNGWAWTSNGGVSALPIIGGGLIGGGLIGKGLAI